MDPLLSVLQSTTENDLGQVSLPPLSNAGVTEPSGLPLLGSIKLLF